MTTKTRNDTNFFSSWKDGVGDTSSLAPMKDPSVLEWKELLLKGHGPINIPESILSLNAEDNELPHKIWQLFFNQDIIEHFTSQTNQYYHMTFTQRIQRRKTQTLARYTWLLANVEKCLQIFPHLSLSPTFQSNFERVKTKHIELFRELSSKKPTSVSSSQLPPTHSKGYNQNFKVTSTLIKGYLMGLLVMYLRPAPTIKDYWSFSIFGFNEALSELIPRDLFLCIHSNLSFDIVYLLDFFKETFKKYWKPFMKLSYDETIFQFLGRFSEKVYIKNKPFPTGIELLELVDQFGYLYAFHFSLGLTLPPDYMVMKEIYDLQKYIVDSCVIGVDSRFTNERLIDYATNHNTAIIGACKADKSPTFKILSQRLSVKNDFTAVHHKHQKSIHAVSFLSTRKVHILTNLFPHDVSLVTEVISLSPSENLIRRVYMHVASFCDRYNARLHNLRFTHRIHKWTNVVFHACLGISLLNSYAIYKALCIKQENKVNLTYRKFLESIYHACTENLPPLRKRDRKLPISPVKPRFPMVSDTDIIAFSTCWFNIDGSEGSRANKPCALCHKQIIGTSRCTICNHVFHKKCWYKHARTHFK